MKGEGRGQKKPTRVVTDRRYRVLWDGAIPTDRKIEARRPDLVVWDDKLKTINIVEVAVCDEESTEERTQQKFEHYLELKDEMARMYIGYNVLITPVVIGILGNTPVVIGILGNTYALEKWWTQTERVVGKDKTVATWLQH